MKRDNYYKLINALGGLFLMLFVVIIIYEVKNFSPYNKRMPFFTDRMLEFLLPGILCFILARIMKNKRK